ncbi:hypothetical protein CMV_003614 [Castanea mollissima]|uniref:Expansin-like EG45 domain-containing protein n=1 Tax=Castanea mollissima TaxID=60419 RepID=A0A8J4RVD8_9ROSI|nr:hypothetical protein CMV_003614 [Castanea mollissima]
MAIKSLTDFEFISAVKWLGIRLDKLGSVTYLIQDSLGRNTLRMYKIQLFIQSLFLVLSFELVYLSQFSHADVGTAAHYRTPYLPTACYGNDATQFPSSNLFASAGEGIWDNGAACGRQYLVRCISAAHPRTCIPGQTIQIRIVDRALSSVSRPSRHGATIVLSKTAFRMIARPSTSYINIEFQQV